MSIKSGGLAFPSEEYGDSGMTLRDWFAGSALQGLLSSGQYREVPTALVAQWSHDIADAMIKVGRSKGGSDE